MLQLIDIVITGATSGLTLQIKGSAFTNTGDMLECKFINDKFNYYRTDKKIDLHLVNYVNDKYVNLGDWVDAKEINHIINDMP
jgi:hypothetical protein